MKTLTFHKIEGGIVEVGAAVLGSAADRQDDGFLGFHNGGQPYADFTILDHLNGSSIGWYAVKESAAEISKAFAARDTEQHETLLKNFLQCVEDAHAPGSVPTYSDGAKDMVNLYWRVREYLGIPVDARL